MFGLFGSGPGEDPASFEPDLDRRRALADLQARVERRAGGWSVQLPLRAEVVRIEKLLVPYEQVVVQQVGTTIRGERLGVGEHGQTVVESGYEPGS